MADLSHLLDRAERLIDQLTALVPLPPPTVDWSAIAWRWQHNKGQGYLEPIAFPHVISLDDLHNIDAQKQEIVRNTE